MNLKNSPGAFASKCLSEEEGPSTCQKNAAETDFYLPPFLSAFKLFDPSLLSSSLPPHSLLHRERRVLSSIMPLFHRALNMPSLRNLSDGRRENRGGGEGGTKIYSLYSCVSLLTSEKDTAAFLKQKEKSSRQIRVAL